MTNQSTEFIIVRPTTPDEHQAQEQLRRQNQDKGRVHKFENLLAASPERQQRLMIISQQNREQLAEGTIMKGKATQTTENPGSLEDNRAPSRRGETDRKQGALRTLTSQQKNLLV